MLYYSFFFHVPAPTEIYTLSLHDALPISRSYSPRWSLPATRCADFARKLTSVPASRWFRPSRSTALPGTVCPTKPTNHKGGGKGKSVHSGRYGRVTWEDATIAARLATSWP